MDSLLYQSVSPVLPKNFEPQSAVPQKLNPRDHLPQEILTKGPSVSVACSHDLCLCIFCINLKTKTSPHITQLVAAAHLTDKVY
jgi:hypothetical protein